MLWEIVLVPALAALLGYGVWKTVQRSRKGSACCGDIPEQETSAQVTDRDRSHYPYSLTLRVTGMTCQNCARRVENALDSHEGVWARVDLGRGTVRVLMKEQVPPRELCALVARAGYMAEEA